MIFVSWYTKFYEYDICFMIHFLYTYDICFMIHLIIWIWFLFHDILFKEYNICFTIHFFMNMIQPLHYSIVIWINLLDDTLSLYIYVQVLIMTFPWCYINKYDTLIYVCIILFSIWICYETFIIRLFWHCLDLLLQCLNAFKVSLRYLCM